MVKNLESYFLNEQEYYLEEIQYERIENDEAGNNVDCSLNCLDSINAVVNSNETVRLTVTRTLEFEPENIFRLKVAFGALLTFDPDKVMEYDWHNINMAEEFRENGEFVLNNLISRISLQIAQITSSFGQMPLILPPTIASERAE
jgi:hypothetical protein